jgi:mitochondrial chaperone BCS1
MTTNHPEVLDDALIRPGRIDSKYLFDNCDKEQIEKLYEMFFNRSPEKTDLNNFKNKVYSPAHITSVFMRYRNQAELALINLDNNYDTINIKSLYEDIVPISVP